MSLVAAGTIEIPDSVGTSFDHGAFEPESRRVFIAHMARDRLEVVDADSSRHVATLHKFPEAAGVGWGEGCGPGTKRGAGRPGLGCARTPGTQAGPATRDPAAARRALCSLARRSV